MAQRLDKDEHGEEVRFLSAWRILSQCPKWGNVNVKRGRGSGSENVEGTKQAKRRVQDDHDRKSVLHQLLDGANQRNKLLRDYNNITLFSREGVDPVRKDQFFDLMERQALEEMKERFNSISSIQDSSHHGDAVDENDEVHLQGIEEASQVTP